MTDFPTIDTPRLRLREIVATDAPTLLAIHGDAEAMRWFGAEPLTDLAEAEKLVEVFDGWRKMPNPGTRWGLERRSDGQFIGTCGLFKWNRGWQSCSLGYELGRAAWGAGWMREALATLLPWGFEHMGLNRIEAQVHPQNVASLRLLEAFGFEIEGCLREAGFWMGQRHDLMQLSLLRRDQQRVAAGIAG